jgi:hypothetical protein
MNFLIHANKVSLDVIYWKVFLARSQREVAEMRLLALLYPFFFACNFSRTIARGFMKFCQGVLVIFAETC